ncbi:radical SAM protein [bacterium]|nr:radical SAM protein [bacterium]
MAVTLRNPLQAAFFLKTAMRQKKAADRRTDWEKKGVHVPPLLIASITNACNLRCSGCYARNHGRPKRPELPVGRWREIISEAERLGMSIVMLAGGEPFTRPEFADLPEEFPDILFPVFTNGMLLDKGMIEKLRKRKNLIPLISVEGGAETTDSRRGEGTYNRIWETLSLINRRRIFYGASITVSRKNLEEAMDPGFLEPFLKNGCQLFIYVEFIPVEPGTEDQVLVPDQRNELTRQANVLRKKYPAEFIVFPGDEEQYGGCLAAGRGFVHIGPDGSLEPCPFAPYSDINVRDIPLEKALASRFLRTIRENHNRLTETRGGCALWANREWVQSLLPGSGDP